jgi:replication-associated recombination protein RarA
MSSSIQMLFTERFRPKELSSLIAVPRIKNELTKGLVQNLLLYGTPGTGKSSTLFIIAKNHPTLYINAREEANIEMIRNKVSKFCATISLEEKKEKLKCILLDEFDGASAAFFDAVKVPIEKYANMARFIASTNYIEKIPKGVQDRFNCISFDPINNEEETYLLSEYKKRVSTILNATKITYTDEILDKFIKNDFPSLRALMVKIQSFYLQGVTELNDKNFNINYDYKDLFELCLSDAKPYENYKFIVGEYSSRIDDAMHILGNDFVEYIKDNHPNKIDKIPLIIIAVAEHQAQRTLVIDPLITLLSCVMKIQIIVNS